MANISDEHLAFMLSLGITADDISDPVGTADMRGCGETSTSGHQGRAEGRHAFGFMQDADMCKTTKAVILTANAGTCKSDPLSKKVVQQADVRQVAGSATASPEQLKEEGNKAFEEGRYRDALTSYTKGIDIILQSNDYGLREHGMIHVQNPTNARCDSGCSSNIRKDDGKLVLLAALLSNRSACYLQAAKQIGTEEAFECAIRDADRAVELRPTWFKGYSRQGDVFFKMKKYSQAVEAYAMALQFDPGNNNLLYSLREARQRSCSAVREDIRASKHQAGNTSPAGTPPMVLRDPASGSNARPEATEVSVGRRATGNHAKPSARRLWSELKQEVEASVNQPTGDNYRLEQLRLFREQKEREKNGHSPSSGKDTQQRDSLSPQGNGRCSMPSTGGDTLGKPTSAKGRLADIPHEFSSDAAAAYQKRLLEEYRRRKAR
uniref:Uncharacterized protein n=1 Tax=Trypanosoma congolense (strain IL3000) TaxID=1068625 RepID=G0UJB0_TRYCI|nr:conserved hypothetical protein [Trypanosoma congolense IL3000]